MIYTNDAIKKRKTRNKNLKKIIYTFFYIILIPILLYNIALIVQAVVNPKEMPSFLGIKTYVIISGSMEPNLNIGDVVIVEKVKEDDLKKGDIITFRQGQSTITHRISNIDESDGKKLYKTKGDNNNTDDSGTIDINEIEGKVVTKIPKIGKISILLQDKIVILLIAVFFYLYLVYTGKISRNKKIRKAKRIEYERKKEDRHG